ncbi:TetR family transcriptional regulator [Rhodococcus sp. NPDC127528]|uniref:TetR/AcrR family transcriptional regulator n=1 Tax=unclassified Rhodococcus (in: high G+C Gram-positive bacteria) TaxID=192944 RepID=UPI0036266B78
MATENFERARSADAKRNREAAILDSATRLALTGGVRSVTLTDIAAGVGMHKSTMLRYFETREEIFLRLAASEWREWSAEVAAGLDTLDADPGAVCDARAAAGILADTLTDRPLFCDLLAHVPLNLERGVSFQAVREFKLGAIAAAGRVADSLGRCGLDREEAVDVVATATGMAGSLWQMAAPGTELRRLYEQDPSLAHAVVDVRPRLTNILTALIAGYSRTADLHLH